MNVLLDLEARRTLARAVSRVEAGLSVEGPTTTSEPAHVVGITGAPGVGKSCLTNALITLNRESGRTVAVLAIDPSSPSTGGSLLGDRLRMSAHVGDAGVFIRSMASRGHLGGLSSSAALAVGVLEGAGFDTVLLETVGVGQSEMDVIQIADTTVWCTAPELGDDVQAAKAGLLEVADILVVNKADRPGAARTAEELQSSVHLRSASSGDLDPFPQVLLTVATERRGIPELLQALDEHWRLAHVDGLSPNRRTGRTRIAIQESARRMFEAGLFEIAASPEDGLLDRLTVAVAAGELEITEAARSLAAQTVSTTSARTHKAHGHTDLVRQSSRHLGAGPRLSQWRVTENLNEGTTWISRSRPSRRTFANSCWPFVAEHVEPADARLLRAGPGVGRSPLPSSGDGGAQGRGARRAACGTCSPRTPSSAPGSATSTTRRCARSWARTCSPGGDELRRARHRQHGDPRRVRDAEQKDEWLVPLLEGEIRSCFAMTEPWVASSDATNIQSRIEPDGDHYVVNAHKWWTTGAASSALQVRDPHGRVGSRRRSDHRHSMIIVPMDAPGVTVVRTLPVFGHDAGGGHCETLFEDVRLPADEHPRRGGQRVRDGAGPPRPRPDPPLHARDRPGREGARADVQPRADAGAVRQATRRPGRDPGPGGRESRMEIEQARLLTHEGGVADGHRRQQGRAVRDRRDQGARRRAPRRRSSTARSRSSAPRACRRTGPSPTCTRTRARSTSSTDPTRCTSSRSPAASFATMRRSGRASRTPGSVEPRSPELGRFTHSGRALS